MSASPAPAARMATNGTAPAPANDDDGKGSLADRMRALQTRASRLTGSS